MVSFYYKVIIFQEMLIKSIGFAIISKISYVLV